MYFLDAFISNPKSFLLNIKIFASALGIYVNLSIIPILGDGSPLMTVKEMAQVLRIERSTAKDLKYPHTSPLGGAYKEPISNKQESKE